MSAVVLLFDSYFGTTNSFAAKETHLASLEGYDAVFGRVDSKVAAEVSAIASTLGHANLAYDNLAVLDCLATE